MRGIGHLKEMETIVKGKKRISPPHLRGAFSVFDFFRLVDDFVCKFCVSSYGSKADSGLQGFLQCHFICIFQIHAHRYAAGDPGNLYAVLFQAFSQKC